jgi:hypothetical protein
MSVFSCIRRKQIFFTVYGSKFNQKKRKFSGACHIQLVLNSKEKNSVDDSPKILQ